MSQTTHVQNVCSCQIILGFQNRSNIDELCINPKDKDKPKNWDGMDFVVVRTMARALLSTQCDVANAVASTRARQKNK